MDLVLTTALWVAGILGCVVCVPLGAKWLLDLSGRRAYDRCAQAWHHYAAGHGLAMTASATLGLQGTTYGVALSISTPRVRAYWLRVLPGRSRALDDKTVVSARPAQPPGGALLVERRDGGASRKPVELDDFLETGDAAFDATYATSRSRNGTVTPTWLTRSRRAVLVRFDTTLRAAHGQGWFYLLVDDDTCQLVWSGMEPDASVLDAACGAVAACSR